MALIPPHIYLAKTLEKSSISIKRLIRLTPNNFQAISSTHLHFDKQKNLA